MRALVICIIGVLAVPPMATAAAGQAPCVARTLVLSAYPAEADAVLARTTLDDDPVVVVDGRHLYRGTLGGEPVLTGMTGIGLVNATDTARAALDGVSCDTTGDRITATVFSGVAGGAGRTSIGDVAIPRRWTIDGGETFREVDAGMLEAAQRLATGPSLPLARVNTAGDPACACTDPALVPIVDLGRQPQLFVGGEGHSSDGNRGEASPCIPGGGDTFGCEPCRAPDRATPDPAATAQAALAWFQLASQSESVGYPPDVYDAVDQETAAVQAVADESGVPFLGIRGMSDGPGDPLSLPGFPFQFFVYKQIAADNAAIAAEAFLRLWREPLDVPDLPIDVPTMVGDLPPVTVPSTVPRITDGVRTSAIATAAPSTAATPGGVEAVAAPAPEARRAPLGTSEEQGSAWPALVAAFAAAGATAGGWRISRRTSRRTSRRGGRDR